MFIRLTVATLIGAIAALAADPALTIYNQNFAVVREIVPLDLKAGINRVRHAGLTALVQPNSVILRDPAERVSLQILEQNYQADLASMSTQLAAWEGKTIDFRAPDGKTIRGRIVRGGSNGAPQQGMFPPPYYNPNAPSQPVIEVDGKLRFGIPGEPQFPAIADNELLEPMLDWTIRSDRAAKFDAELGYISGGMTWKADYNVLSAGEDGNVQFLGWVTIANQTGKRFENARIALMAGEVNKLQPQTLAMSGRAMMIGGGVAGVPAAPPVSEKPFDEYHLYTLQNRTTLSDRETKQVEFLRASKVRTQRIYVYDGAQIDSRFAG